MLKFEIDEDVLEALAEGRTDYVLIRIGGVHTTEADMLRKVVDLMDEECAECANPEPCERCRDYEDAHCDVCDTMREDLTKLLAKVDSCDGVTL